MHTPWSLQTFFLCVNIYTNDKYYSFTVTPLKWEQLCDRPKCLQKVSPSIFRGDLISGCKHQIGQKKFNLKFFYFNFSFNWFQWSLGHQRPISRQSAQMLPGWTTDVPRNPVQSTEEEEVWKRKCVLIHPVNFFACLAGPATWRNFSRGWRPSWFAEKRTKSWHSCPPNRDRRSSFRSKSRKPRRSAAQVFLN
jgi:hypothetical protein